MSVSQKLQSVQSNWGILHISVSGSGADQSALCCCNHRFVLDLYVFAEVSRCFTCCSGRLSALLCNRNSWVTLTLEWQVEKVINILAQWWPVLLVIKCHVQEICHCCHQEKGESCLTVFVFDKAAKINLQFLQLKAQGRNKVMLVWDEVNTFHSLLQFNCFTLKRQNQIYVDVRKENSLSDHTFTVFRMHFF